MLSRLVLLGILAVSASAVPLGPSEKKTNDVIDHNLIDEINHDGNSTWVAGINEIFKGMTMAEARQKMLGLRMDRKYDHVPVKTYAKFGVNDDGDIPESFNSYEQWPTFMHPIRDQAHCGSCWAFAASEVLSDRFAVATNGSINKVLSPEDLVSCDTGDMGCNGGYLDHAWEYLKDTGIVTESCFPYSAQKGKAAVCIKACTNGESFVKYKAKDFYQVKTETDMQKEIMTNGPVEAGFVVYTSFMSYKSGVYHKRLLDVAEGGHAIKIVGWGVEPPQKKWQKPQKYWLCANSWTEQWGMKGFFKIRRGADFRGKSECDIQGSVFAGHPMVTSEQA